MKATTRRFKSKPDLKVDVSSNPTSDDQQHPTAANNTTTTTTTTNGSAGAKPKRPLISSNATKRFSRFRSFHRPRSTASALHHEEPNGDSGGGNHVTGNETIAPDTRTSADTNASVATATATAANGAPPQSAATATATDPDPDDVPSAAAKDLTHARSSKSLDIFATPLTAPTPLNLPNGTADPFIAPSFPLDTQSPSSSSPPHHHPSSSLSPSPATDPPHPPSLPSPPPPASSTTTTTTSFIHPLESRLSTARANLHALSLWPLITGAEPRPPPPLDSYTGDWANHDESLARRHSAWIGRDARAKRVIRDAMMPCQLDVVVVGGGGKGGGGGGYVDARAVWRKAEEACAEAVRGVGRGLLNEVGGYQSAAQVCGDLERVQGRVRELAGEGGGGGGGLDERQVLGVLWAYYAMHPLDRCIFGKSLLLVHPKGWGLEMMRRQEVVWDSVFDELFDLESDWSYRVEDGGGAGGQEEEEEEEIVITIKDGDGGEEGYRVSIDVLLEEFKILVVKGYEEWLAGHPTHFQKCDEKCVKRNGGKKVMPEKEEEEKEKEQDKRMPDGEVHFRTRDEEGGGEVAKEALDVLKERFGEGDMDRFRPPGKRSKAEEGVNGR
ncbi:MAG: hypothetical protein Q9227_006697 [Pyrenula ochraceoflavens]